MKLNLCCIYSTLRSQTTSSQHPGEAFPQTEAKQGQGDRKLRGGEKKGKAWGCESPFSGLWTLQ